MGRREVGKGYAVLTLFQRYIGIDYSGAKDSTASLTGLRVYLAEGKRAAAEVLPPPRRRKYWTRAGIAEWLVGELRRDVPTIVGIDHGFSFPEAYFQKHGMARRWDAFLTDFCAHWPTDHAGVWVRDVRDGRMGAGTKRTGEPSWLRRTEAMTRSDSSPRATGAGAKSVFRFGVHGEVASSTHAGLPWLRHIREQCPHAHVWPFDGWDIAPGRSVLLEVYPRLWKDAFPAKHLTDDQRDARAVACWLQRADRHGELRSALSPPLTRADRVRAAFEGWILASER